MAGRWEGCDLYGHHGSRYGFIITDTWVVALRITCRPISPGLATERSRRPITAATTTAGHQKQPSDVSMTSGASSFYDDDPLCCDYYDPEYVAIPWATHGPGKLTIKLGVGCLAMMAANGNSFIDFRYPDLDGWCSGDGGYVHNT